jgi:glutathione peroxidase
VAFTPRYERLEALYTKYCAQGFVVLGFPCNQFGGQEPGDAAEIARFCSRKYQVNVTFPMFGKIDVNGTGLIRFTGFSKAKPRELWERGRSNGILRNSIDKAD